jgi:hypothetical protein
LPRNRSNRSRPIPVPRLSRKNSIATLGIQATDGAPSGDDISIEYRDQHYSLKPETGYQWNHEGFTLLHQIFQMTIAELPRVGIPSLTIAK